MAFLIPILRPMISTTGVMQFVVQLAQETICAGVLLRSVHCVDDGRDVIALRRSRQNNKTRPGFDVLDEIVSSCKHACTLEHDVDTHLTPRQLRRFTFAQNRIVDAINIQTAVTAWTSRVHLP